MHIHEQFSERTENPIQGASQNIGIHDRSVPPSATLVNRKSGKLFARHFGTGTYFFGFGCQLKRSMQHPALQ